MLISCVFPHLQTFVFYVQFFYPSCHSAMLALNKGAKYQKVTTNKIMTVQPTKRLQGCETWHGIRGSVCMYKNAPSYIKEAHLSSLLTTVRADKLDKLLERLLGVVAYGVVGEVRARLLDDWRRREMKTWRRGVRTRWKKDKQWRLGQKSIEGEEGWKRGSPWRKDVDIVVVLCLVGLLMHMGTYTQRWSVFFMRWRRGTLVCIDAIIDLI